MELRQRYHQKPGDEPPSRNSTIPGPSLSSSYSTAASPGYKRNYLAQRGSSTGSVAVDIVGSSGVLPTYRAPPTAPSPPPPPPPPPQRAVSFTDGNGCSTNRHQPQRGAASTGSANGKSSSSSRGRLLLKLYLFALVALACTALFFRTVMFSLQYELAIAASSAVVLQQQQQQQQQQQRELLEKEIREMTSQMKQYEITHLDLLRRNDDIARKLQTLNTKSFATQKSILHTTNAIADAALEVDKYRALVQGVDSVSDYVRGREGTLWDRITNLRSKIVRESRRETLEWFGPGPYRVEFRIDYPHAANNDYITTNPDEWKTWTSYILIEMASLKLMPHTVNQFLKQVHSGLWDGTSVAMNARHVMQFGPRYTSATTSDNGDDTANVVDGGGGGGKKRYQDFYDRGIDKLSFQEYSAQYPHAQWTVGLAGRPSGPDFYINKIDNTIRHGPGGQMHTGEMHNEADPCFGKLIDGTRPFTSIIDAIDMIPVERYDKYPISIVNAFILIPKLDGSGWRAINRGEKWDENDKIMPL